MSSTTQSQAGRSRRWRRLRRAVGWSFVVLVLVVSVAGWQLPWLAGTGAGKSLIEKLINGAQSSVTVRFGALDLAWSGTQQVTGLSVVDRATGDTADVDVSAQGSLIDWARGGRDFGTVTVSGTVSMSELPKSRGPGPVTVPAGLGADVQIKDLTVNLAHAAVGADGAPVSASVTVAEGAIGVHTGQPLEVMLTGTSKLGGDEGLFTVEVEMPDLIGADGVVHLDRLNGEVKANARNVPCGVIEQLAGQSGRIVPYVGELADVDCSWDGALEQGSGSLHLMSELATADVFFEVADGHVRIETPAQVRWTATPSAVASLAWPVPIDVTVSSLDAKLPVGGVIDLAGASLVAEVSSGGAIEVLMAPDDAQRWAIDGLHVSVETADAVNRIAVKVSGNVGESVGHGGDAGNALSPVSADLALQGLLTADGRLSLGTLGVGGTIRGEQIPTALIDRLAGLDGWVVDALGPYVAEVEVDAAVDAGAVEHLAGSDGGAGGALDLAGLPRTTFTVRTRSRGMMLVADGVVDKGIVSVGDAHNPGRLEIRPSEALLDRAMAMPAVSESLPAGFRVAQAQSVFVAFERLTIPLTADGTQEMLAQAAWNASVELRDVLLHGGAVGTGEDVHVASMKIKSSTDRLSDSVRVDVDGTIQVGEDAEEPARFVVQSEVLSALDAGRRSVNVTSAVDNVPAGLADLSGVEVSGMSLGELVNDAIGSVVSLEAQASLVSVTGSDSNVTPGLAVASLRSRVQGQQGLAEVSLVPGSGESAGDLLAAGRVRARVTPAMYQRLAVAEGDETSDQMGLSEAATVDVQLSERAVPADLVVQSSSSAVGTGNAVMPLSRLAGYDWRAAAVGVTGTVDRIALEHVPGVTRPIVAEGLAFDVSAPFGVLSGTTVTAHSAVLTQASDDAVAGAAAAATLGSVNVSARSAPGVDGALVLSSTIACTGIDLAVVEGLLGWTHRMLPTAFGRVGDVTIQVDGAGLPSVLGGREGPAFSLASMFEPATIRVTPALPRMTGNLVIRQPSSGAINVSASHLNYSIDSAMVEGFLNGETLRSSDAEALGAAAAEILRQSGDDGARLANRLQNNMQPAWMMVNKRSLLGVTIDRLDVPLDLLLGRSFNLTNVSASGAIGMDDLLLARGDTQTAFRDMRLTVGGTNAAEGLAIKLTGSPTVTTAGGVEAEPVEPTAAAGEPQNAISLTGMLHALAGDTSVPVVDMKGGLRKVPVGVVDSMLNLGGRLEAALGTTADVQLDMSDVGRHSGHGSMVLTSANGTVQMPSLAWDGVSVTALQPVAAQFAVTPEFSDSLLSLVHPALTSAQGADGRTPLSVNIKSLTVPVNGDLSLLGGDFDLDLGQLQLKRSGMLSDLLGTLADRPEMQASETTTALIPPVAVSIRQGMLHYDQLDIKSDLFTISSKGNVDLVKRQLDLGVRVPLLGWRNQFSQLTKTPMGQLGGASVTDLPFYLTVTGSLDDPKIQPDPKGAKKVADEFFKNVLEDTVKGVFGEILGGQEKDKEKEKEKKK